MFLRAVETRQFKPMAYTRYIPFPSHLLYADDILLFCKADVNNARTCQRILHDYGQLSGQVCNSRKSHIYFGKGVPTHLKCRLSRLLGFQQGLILFTYLGIPLFVGHPRASHLLHTKDKVLAHFSKWKGNQLSTAGRICLVRSVIQSSIIHSMLVYRWPASFLHELDRSCRNFIWSGDIGTKPSCSVSWKTVCTSYEKGGLNVRSFSIMNECLLSKLAWRITVDTGLCFSLLRSKYLNARLHPKWLQQISSVWTSVRRSFSRISEETFCSIGNGTSVLFWLDDWLGYRLSDKLHIPPYMHKFLTQTVSDYLYDGIWHFTQDFFKAYPDIVYDILTLTLGDEIDVRFWKPAAQGQVTPQLMFSHLTSGGISVKWGSWIWAPYIPLRRSLLCWRLIHNRLPTIDLLQRRGFQGPNFCCLCASAAESIDHVFWRCNLAAVVWYSFLSWFGLQDLRFPGYTSFLVYAMDRRYSPQLSKLWKLGILTVTWYIWYSRNRCIWDEVPASSIHILKMTKAAMQEAMSTFSLGCCSRAWTDYVILRNLGLTGSFSAPADPIYVRWWPPLSGWIKANTDGSAAGAPGRIGAGRVFRDSLSSVRGCFHLDGGHGHAYEAELFAVIAAIEIAHTRNWNKLWIETDSTYIVGLVATRSHKVPWRFFKSWQITLTHLAAMDIRISHIYREGNSVADILASDAVPVGWWPHIIPQIQLAVARDAHTHGCYRNI